MAPKQPAHTTQTTRVELPAWVDAASRKNYQFAEDIAAKPYNPYLGETVAPTSETSNQAFNLFRNNLTAGNDNFSRANELLKQKGGGILGLDRNNYMNPYITEVEEKSLGALEDARVQALMKNADKAISAGAFGGSRSAIIDAVTNAESIKDAGLLSAELRSEGFNNATQQMLADLNIFGDTAQQEIGLGNAAIDKRTKDFAGLLGIGQQEETKSQQILDDAKRRFDEAENYDLEQLNVLLSALGMSPYGKTESTEKISDSGSSGVDFGTLGLGIFSLLFGLSDRTEKTDIKKVGTDKNTGIPLYSYRYKGDPKSYPKVVGPMAQDIEKAYP